MTDLIRENEERQRWLAKRSTGIGASEAAAVIGADPYLSPLALWERKTGRVEEPDLGNVDSVNFGKRLEPVVADIFCEQTGNKVRDLGRYHMLHHPDRAHVFATLDRIIEASDEAGEGALEIKCTTEYLKDEWEVHASTRSMVQTQVQMYVAGLSWGAVAALIGGNKLRIYPVTRDEELLGMVLDSVDKFWNYNVLKDVAPPADGSDSSKKALNRLYPTADTDGSVVILPDEANGWHTQYVMAAEKIKHWSKKKEEASNLLKQAIGGGLYGKLENGKATYKCGVVERSGYTVQPTTYRRLYLTNTEE